MKCFEYFIRKILAIAVIASVMGVWCFTGSSLVYADGYNQGLVDFVTSLYSDCLGRTPDSAGLNDWCSKLASGQNTGKQCAYGFFFSSEFQSKANSMTDDELIDAYYKVFLNRNADASGKSYWLSQISGTTNDISVLFTGFADSPEFADKCLNYGITAGQHINVPTTIRNSISSNCSVTEGDQIVYVLARSNHYVDGRLQYWMEYQYNNDGKLLKEIRHWSDGTVKLDTEYIYDGQGFLTQKISYDVSGGPSNPSTIMFREEYQYDNQGNRIRETNYYYQSGSITFIEVKGFQYDAQGNMIWYAFYNDDGSVNAPTVHEYQYDDQGHKLREILAGGINTSVYLYDNQSRLTNYISYSRDGSVYYEAQYDSHENIIRSIYYNEDGSVFNDTSIVYQYDERGNIVRETYSYGTSIEYIYSGINL